LEQLQAQGEMQVWAEADAKVEVRGRDRHELDSARVLAIWTTPPGSAELQGALERVSPQVIYLFDVLPGQDGLEGFLRRLAGLTKYALGAGKGRVSISTLAAATAQREATVRAGLAWLVACGHLSVLNEDGDRVHLATGDGRVSDDLSQATTRLKALLEETAAYRAHFGRADKDSLFA
jgi:hypothetical protein